MNRLHLCVEEVNSFEKLLNSSLYEVLVKSTVFHKHYIHIANAHLRNLKSERDMLPMGALDFKRGEQFSYVVGASMLTRPGPS